MDRREASRILDAVLTERILEHWRHAEAPAILLSGGYDSQYIFHAIAKSVEDTSKLTTVTWGQNPGKRYADMDIARRTAEHFGTKHIEIVKTLDRWRVEYDEMFKAQNGMTDSSFYHAHELTVCKNLRYQYGIRSVMRGDECLGYGSDAFSSQNALLANSMSLPEYVHGLADWFGSENHSIIDQYSQFIVNLLHQYQSMSYDCLKDELDFYERQYMNRNPLNYYKLHYLEVFCPLIDPDVLGFICKLPSRFRRHKQLFKELLKSKLGRQLDIAEYTNLTNWESVICGSSELKKFFIEEFSNLPSFFNPDFFNNLTLSLVYSSSKDIKTQIKNLARPLKRVMPVEMVWQALTRKSRSNDQRLHVPTQMLVIRAAVLARWNDWWISCN
jgi:asparagine synthetase B (glutamine-hydrolysing)